MKNTEEKIELAYELAGERYAAMGVDTAKVLQQLDEIPISIQCWQGDDVRGFENPTGDLTGGIQTSGNYPGRARTGDELRADLDVAFAQIPGKSGSICTQFILNRQRRWSATRLNRSISIAG